ncbi:nuclease-related domain-containing protein [Lysobacter niabensis]|uniref:nuclease-related domain-containing protein n=1 Tax=Agrilutibacter niabensis TaxID=380628 RepID=UPI00362048BE
MSWINALIVIGSIFIPTFIAVGLFFGYRKWQDRDGRRSPIENRAIYGAGEQLRKRVDAHTDDMMLGLAMLYFLGPFFLAFWAMQRVDWSRVQLNFWDWFLAAMFLVMAGAAIWRIFSNGNQRRMANAGLQAELYTAQELNRLMALGCTVLHDIPGEKFNIDHVVIGPRAVYAIETKSVRKPRATDAKDHFKVVYDGQSLRFPDFTNTKKLHQTKRQAEWLSAYLRKATGQSVPVIPALALPGWWIDSGQVSAAEVRVFNPAGRGAQFMADRAGIMLDAGTTGLVTQALVMRYPAEGSVK